MADVQQACRADYNKHDILSAQWHTCSHRGKTDTVAPVANLQPVSLSSVVHLDLRKSPRIFEKIRNDPIVIIRGLGEGDS
jgi:hypothetical protein